MTAYTIAIVVGSLRKELFNRKLANALIKLAPSGFSFKFIEIGELPLYNQDDDGQQAPNVLKMKSEIAAANGLIFVTPEYNRSFPGVLKNALDHGSRPYGKNAWAGKPSGVIGASVGSIGTAVAQTHLRGVLSYLDVRIMGQPEAYLHVNDKFFDVGGNISPDSKAFVQKWMDAYVAWVNKHA